MRNLSYLIENHLADVLIVPYLRAANLAALYPSAENIARAERRERLMLDAITRQSRGYPVGREPRDEFIAESDAYNARHA